MAANTETSQIAQDWLRRRSRVSAVEAIFWLATLAPLLLLDLGDAIGCSLERHALLHGGCVTDVAQGNRDRSQCKG